LKIEHFCSLILEINFHPESKQMLWAFWDQYRAAKPHPKVRPRARRHPRPRMSRRNSEIEQMLRGLFSAKMSNLETENSRIGIRINSAEFADIQERGGSRMDIPKLNSAQRTV
jgi:hypothetical protein